MKDKKQARNPSDLLQLLHDLYRHLSQRRRWQIKVTLVLMLLTSLAEMISLGAVVPFLAVLAQPTVLWNTEPVQSIAPLLGWQHPADTITPVCLAFAASALTAGIIRVLVLWVNNRLASAVGSDLSSEVYQRTLYQPYATHVVRNSSEVISTITVQVGATVGIIYSLLQLVTSSLVFVGLSVTLLFINASVALLATAIFGLAYSIVIIAAQRRLRLNSMRIVIDQQLLLKVLQEGLGGIRDVLLNDSQPAYVNLYRLADRRFRLAQGSNGFLSSYPRYALEALGMVLIAGIAWGTNSSGGSLMGSLPVLGALALGAQRLLPTFQQIYSTWASVSGSQEALRVTLSYLQQPIPATALMPVSEPLSFRQELRFEKVSFAYSFNLPPVIKDLELCIRPGERIGFVGVTGSGKSTCLDLLMGLLSPTKGRITVDGEELQGSAVRAWQQQIAHVPQSIYLADTSIAENIAFGIPVAKIDRGRVQKAAQQAQIAEFIESKPAGYDTYVGERGVRLSGGQRQRIGIARALYKQAQVMVFDEATSALDNETEAAVMETIEGLDRNLTILMIAHRLSTVARCDRVIELSLGKVVREDTPLMLDLHS